MDAFKREQRGVALAMAAALVLTILALGAAAVTDHEPLPSAERLRIAMTADVLVVAWLAAAIANVARLRFFSEQDIAGSSTETSTVEVRRAGAILQNTLEQVVLAVTAHMIVAASFPHARTLIVTLACLFAIGRLLFWIGYRHGARARAFGFALTFYPSVLALIASAARLL